MPSHFLSNIVDWPVDMGCNDCVATLKPGGLKYLLQWPQLAVSTYGTFIPGWKVTK